MASLPLSDLTERPRGVLVVNPAARKGTALKHFARVRPAVEARVDATTVVVDLADAWVSRVGEALDDGVRLFIAAGGDGTAHALLNALERQRGAIPLASLTLGAIGLGSSNDLHKPVRATLEGVPARIDPRTARPRDVVRVRYEGADAHEGTRLFLVSASLGLVAAANAFFNRGDPLLRLLDRSWTSVAIVYAALRTIVRYRDLPARVGFPRGPRSVALTNLSVMKTPYLSGGFRYDTPVAPDDGVFAVNFCEGLGFWGALRLLANLARGRFVGTPGTHHWAASVLTAEFDAPVDLELDGEILRIRRARFEVNEERIRLCAS